MKSECFFKSFIHGFYLYLQNEEIQEGTEIPETEFHKTQEILGYSSDRIRSQNEKCL